MNIGNVCYIANVGDSRAIVFTDEHGENICLTTDHKPDHEIEEKRIKAHGGSIY